MAVFDLYTVYFSKLPSGMASWNGKPSRPTATLWDWIWGGAGQCTGIVKRALVNLGIKCSPENPRQAADWAKNSGVYREVDAVYIIQNPQIGDILTYQCPTSGHPYKKGDHTYHTDRTGHTVMYLPDRNKIRVGQKTNVPPSDCCWCSDHTQVTWWTYGGQTKYRRLRGFRWTGQIKWFDGSLYNSNLNVPGPRANFGYDGGLEGDDYTKLGGARANIAGNVSGTSGVTGGGYNPTITTRTRDATAEEIEREKKRLASGGQVLTGSGAAFSATGKRPKVSTGKLGQVMDMRACLEFLHYYPDQDGAKLAKSLHRRYNKKTCGTYCEPTQAGYLCSTFCKLAALYGMGAFTWEQACACVNESDLVKLLNNSTGGKGKCESSSNPNGWPHSESWFGYSKIDSGDDSSGVASTVEGFASTGKTNPTDVFRVNAVKHGSGSHIIMWGGDQWISDYRQGMKIVGDASRNRDHYDWYRFKGTIVDIPSNFSFDTSSSGGSSSLQRIYFDEKLGKWMVEETGYYDENGNFILSDGSEFGGAFGANVIPPCPEHIVFKGLWDRYWIWMGRVPASMAGEFNVNWDIDMTDLSAYKVGDAWFANCPPTSEIGGFQVGGQYYKQITQWNGTPLLSFKDLASPPRTGKLSISNFNPASCGTATELPNKPGYGALHNNPGNVSAAGQPGCVGSKHMVDSQKNGAFSSMPYGVAACLGTIKKNCGKYDAVTLTELNTKAGYQGFYSLNKHIPIMNAARIVWISDVAKIAGISPHDTINFNDKSSMLGLCRAISIKETGVRLGSNDLEAGWNIYNTQYPK